MREDESFSFDAFYRAAARGEVSIPWDRGAPHPLVEAWTRGLDGRGKTALVTGAGLGADAELIASRGYAVLAFDISPTALAMARERFPDSKVDYRLADLLDPPVDWRRRFDLVVESLTVQSLPLELHEQATCNVADLVAAGGTLLVVATARAENEPVHGPPWPLTPTEIAAFATGGLEPVGIEQVREPNTAARWRAVFRRP